MKSNRKNQENRPKEPVKRAEPPRPETRPTIRPKRRNGNRKIIPEKQAPLLRAMTTRNCPTVTAPRRPSKTHSRAQKHSTLWNKAQTPRVLKNEGSHIKAQHSSPVRYSKKIMPRHRAPIKANRRQSTRKPHKTVWQHANTRKRRQQKPQNIAPDTVKNKQRRGNIS